MCQRRQRHHAMLHLMRSASPSRADVAVPALLLALLAAVGCQAHTPAAPARLAQGTPVVATPSAVASATPHEVKPSASQAATSTPSAPGHAGSDPTPGKSPGANSAPPKSPSPSPYYQVSLTTKPQTPVAGAPADLQITITSHEFWVYPRTISWGDGSATTQPANDTCPSPAGSGAHTETYSVRHTWAKSGQYEVVVTVANTGCTGPNRTQTNSLSVRVVSA